MGEIHASKASWAVAQGVETAQEYVYKKTLSAVRDVSIGQGVLGTAIPLDSTIASPKHQGRDHSWKLEQHFVEQEELFSVPTQSAGIKDSPSNQQCSPERKYCGRLGNGSMVAAVISVPISISISIPAIAMIAVTTIHKDWVGQD